MAENSDTEVSNVIPLKTPKATRETERKWGKGVIDIGYCILPSLLFKCQRRLGLSPQQLNVILHLADHWWTADQKPFPSRETIAERMNVSARQVSRYISELKRAGLVDSIEQMKPGKGQVNNLYDLTGLVKKLKSFEPEFRDLIKARKAATRPGGIAASSKKKSA